MVGTSDGSGRGQDDVNAARAGAFGRRSFLKGAAAGAGAVGFHLGGLAMPASAAPNTISTENAKPGTPSSEWDSYEDPSIEGFATDISVNAGDTVRFKVATDSTAYRIRIYRMGWYQGHGARRVADLLPSAALPQVQPPPLTDADFPGRPATGLVDCGNWAVSASWQVPADAVSGVYFANFERLDEPGVTNRAMFVVRNDGRATDVLVQTSDTTMHAYNRWGGNSLYYGETLGRAFKVSYNRPFRIDGHGNAFWDAEYPLVRWLERNGYDVAYTTCVDTDRRGAELLKHRVFVSSGHDEYWSPAQRANVEAARDAGVHLVFMAGNEVFWKIRWEPSTDPSATARRTLVCYKETLAGAKLDPTPEWTGTWRDPRFSPPSDGGRPELPLIGQIFGAINDETQPDLTIKVPAAYGALRFWRHTDVASAPPGATTALTAGTLGYEWDDDREVGPKPGGLVELTSTTETVPAVLTDHGGNYVAGPATHRLTVYRAPSGALVWGTGTCQWAWGLDDTHPREGGAPQGRMQQATANMLADMGALPATLQSNLVAPSPTTDHTPPVTTITTPAPEVSVPVGTPTTVTGTAADAGGTVAAVEVSVDGGTTWARAAGTTAWSFTFLPSALGPLTIKARGVDDSVNIESPGSAVTVTGAPRGFPASIWHASTVPGSPSINDANPIEVGLKFRTVEEGFATGVRFYKGPGNTGTHVGHLWSASGTKLAEVTFAAETAGGWQQALFPTPVPLAPNTTYVVSYYAPVGHYAGDVGGLAAPYDVWPLRALGDGEDGSNGRFRYGSSGFPDTSYAATNYWVDVVFDVDDHRAPTVVDRAPAPGLDGVALDAEPSAKFSEAMSAGSIALELRDAGGAVVAGTTTYAADKRRATFRPEAPLDPVTTYTVRVASARDRSGASIAAPVEWTFTTTGDADQYPLTVWDTSTNPATPSVTDTLPVELGVKFRADVAGFVKGVRYHRGPANGGGHVAHLWTLDGQLIGTAPFTDESETGWQQADFPEPVPVVAGTTYVASYFAPAGGYAATGDAFGASGVDRGVLHVPRGQGSGGNGVFRYGSSGFPSSSYNDTDYGVDVSFVVPPDTTGPVVVDHAPGHRVVSVVTGTTVRATFDEAIAPGSLTMALSGPSGAVAATTAYDPATRTATLTPSGPLAEAALHTVTVSAADTHGNVMSAPFTWVFTTVTPTGATPATLWDSATVPATPAANDASAIELGLRFRADSDGHVTGIRFHKGPGNVGPHVGHLWRTDGALLATVPFAAETASGWQQADLTTPVPVTAGQTYVVSYHAPAGRYSVTADAFSAAGVDRAPLHALRSGVDGTNGVFRYGPGGFPTSGYNNAWYGVDVVFVDMAGPSVVARTPVADATGVPLDAGVAATFGEPVDASGLTLTLHDDTAGGNVGGTWAYEADSRTVTFAPTALAPGHTYTMTVAGAVDQAANPMTSPHTWSFTTATSAVRTLWPAGTVPAVAAANDGGAIEVGLKFRVDVAGRVIGVRFHKGPGNTGTHVGRLYRSDGALLGTVTFDGESPTGWQQADFATPVAVDPGVTYVVTYHAPVGRYSVNGGAFSAAGVDSGPLHALRSGEDGGNGVYRYGGGGVLPADSWNASNYWIDIAFQEGQ